MAETQSPSTKQAPREKEAAPLQEDTGEKAIAAGLANLFLPVVKELDVKIQSVLQSQSDLSDQIEALSQELGRFSNISQTPSLAPYVNKLLSARRRLYNLNTVLRTIKDRLDRLNILASEQRARRQRPALPSSQTSPHSLPPSQYTAGIEPAAASPVAQTEEPKVTNEDAEHKAEAEAETNEESS